MQRTVCALALVLAACGVDPSEDDRPRTMDYITSAVLKPYCGNAQCHSSFRQAANRAYDLVSEACKSLTGDVIPGDPDGSMLIQVTLRTIDRMPYDQPLPNVERDLIADWITINAPGLPANPEDCP